MQPDGDWSCRANCGSELVFRLINDLVLNYAPVRLGRFTKHFDLKSFNVTNSVPNLGTKLDPSSPPARLVP